MKITALLLVLTFVFSFAACEKTPADLPDPADTSADESTTPEETTADPLADNLPAETYDGADIRIWIDGHDKYQGMDPEAEYIEGDVIHDAIVFRDETVADRFDVVLTLDRDLSVSARDRGVLRQSILGGDEYDLICMPVLHSTTLVTYGCYVDLADNTYIDFEKPWWIPYATETMKIGDRQFLASGFFDFQTITRTMVFFFNANMVEDYDLGNPYDLVESGDWTWDTMMEMSETVSDDVNSDGIYDENDNYGISSRWDFWMGQTATIGYQFTTMQEDGMLAVTGLTDALSELHEKIYPYITGSNTYWSGYTYGVHSSYAVAAPYDTAAQNMFCNDQLLFRMCDMGWTGSELLRDFGAYGILPSPKYVEGQENYGTATVPHTSSICVTTGDYALSSIILEALQAESYKQLRPAYFETALSKKYLNDPQAVEMLDFIFASITCEFTYNFADAGIGRDLAICLSTQPNLASFFASKTDMMTEKLITFMDQVNAIPAYEPQ